MAGHSHQDMNSQRLRDGGCSGDSTQPRLSQVLGWKSLTDLELHQRALALFEACYPTPEQTRYRHQGPPHAVVPADPAATDDVPDTPKARSKARLERLQYQPQPIEGGRFASGWKWLGFLMLILLLFLLILGTLKHRQHPLNAAGTFRPDSGAPAPSLSLKAPPEPDEWEPFPGTSEPPPSQNGAHAKP